MGNNMVRVRVTLKGKRPLLQNHFGPDAIPLEKGEKTGVAGNDPTEWHKTKMVTSDGQLYIESSYVFACMRSGAKHTKKGRGSLQPLVSATLQVEEEVILLDRWVPKSGPTKDRTQAVYLDVRGVKNPGSGGRNIRYRLAAAAGWVCSFTINFDKTIVTRAQMEAVLHDSGNLAGLGDGYSIGFGKFDVTAWEEMPDATEETAAGSVEDHATNGVGAGRKKVRALPATRNAEAVPH